MCIVCNILLVQSDTYRYASLDYEDSGYEKSDIVKLQLLVNKEPVDAICQVMHRSQTQHVGKQWVTKFKEFVQRELFEVVIQAAVGNKVVARETVKAVRKDVTAKLYGGDRTRRMKLLEKQKEGRKKLQCECPSPETYAEYVIADSAKLLGGLRSSRSRSRDSCRRSRGDDVETVHGEIEGNNRLYGRTCNYSSWPMGWSVEFGCIINGYLATQRAAVRSDITIRSPGRGAFM